jgi:hypothetical protein
VQTIGVGLEVVDEGEDSIASIACGGAWMSFLASVLSMEHIEKQNHKNQITKIYLL